MKIKTCFYCQKPIKSGEKIKTFRSKKRSTCHLNCYQFFRRMKATIDIQNGKVSKSPYILIREKGDPWQIRNTPDGVCPYCDQVIQKDDVVKKFRLIKNKSCHLKCYQDWNHYKWQDWIIFCFLGLFLIGVTVLGFLEIFEKI